MARAINNKKKLKIIGRKLLVYHLAVKFECWCKYYKYLCWKCRSSCSEVFLKISLDSQENTCARISFLIKLQVRACNFIKRETLVQVFSCAFCEISNNNFYYRTRLVAVSENVDCYRLVAVINLFERGMGQH